MMKEDKTFELLTEMIDKAFSNYYKKDNKVETEPLPKSTEQDVILTIEEYTRQTGKRFRMTKDQKARNLSREDAFTETFGETN
tara:strand:+ start:668 stop:916 length:249 start_codon:yes stop_codon:yes gene_type:complete